MSWIIRQSSDDPAVGIGDENLSIAVRCPNRQGMLERRCSAAGISPKVSCRMIKLKREIIGKRLDRLPRFSGSLASLLKHLNSRADTDRDQKGDDENRNGAPQQRLGAEKPSIRGFGNRFCQPLNRIGS